MRLLLVIANNTALAGGGVTVDWTGSFTMRDKSVISSNAAYDGGGGIVVYSGGNVELLGGTISNNVASGNGGGVQVTSDNALVDFGRLSVGENVVFSNNSASTAYSRSSSHDAVYNAQIKGTSWSSPFTQGTIIMI
ncbi:MAG: hypothetical protein FWF66_03705 [Candidatus Bathyarchaeota archaeon]|nr:hypothetical protein [Candidatus Termiticorpusculum sp.]MCL1970545.1 hypothetical protein [Candidatus Termiticorpusculum sp.]